jgi:hypothetical protein
MLASKSLQDVSGALKPRQLLCIMGHSGAGYVLHFKRCVTIRFWYHLLYVHTRALFLLCSTLVLSYTFEFRKTSFLNILAGRLVSSETSLSVTRETTMDGKVDLSSINVKRKIAFVAQRTDTLVATDTPREAIRFSAKLRLSSKVTGMMRGGYQMFPRQRS